MGLGDRNLGAGFMNQGYGAASTMDEQEIIRMRAANGGRADIEDAYGRSGNMRVAKTLAYYGGGRRYQKGGKVVQGTGNDPYEYRQDGENYYTRKKGEGDWNQTDGGARDSIKSKYFANTGPTDGRRGLGDRPTLEEDRPGFVGPIIPENRDLLDEASRAPKEKDNALDILSNSVAETVRDIRGPQYNEVPVPEDTSGLKPPTPNPDAYVGPNSTDPRIEDAGAGTGGGGGGGGGTTTPTVQPEIDPIVGGLTPYQQQMKDLAAQLAASDEEIFKADDAAAAAAAEAAANGEDPVDPTWWQENQSKVFRGAGNVATGLLNIAPNIANINAYNNMEGVRTPNLARAATVDAPSMEAGRQAIIAQGRNASNQAAYSGTQSQTAGNAAAMAGTQSALSQYAGQEAQVEAQYDARNTQALNQVNQINTQTLNKNLAQQDARNMMQLRGVAQERAGIGSKTLGFLGGLDQQRLDRERMDLTRQRYNIYGQLDRAVLKQFDETGVLPTGYRTPQGG